MYGFFYDIFNVYEFQEKENIEYYWGRIAKSKDYHDDWRGSQGRNIEYQQGRKAKVDFLHGLRKGEGGQMLTGIKNLAALPQTPNQIKTWKPEALTADT